MRARTAQSNQIRELPGELDLVVPQGIGYIATRVSELIEGSAHELPGAFSLLIQRPLDQLKEPYRRVPLFFALSIRYKSFRR